MPISLSVYTQALMDEQGTRQIDDIARLTPGLTFFRGMINNNSESSDIAIRGIDSTAGTATTGIYIDDVPFRDGTCRSAPSTPTLSSSTSIGSKY